jgi:hypothetical protein
MGYETDRGGLASRNLFAEASTGKERNCNDAVTDESRSRAAVTCRATFSTETLAPAMKSVDVQSVQGPFS